MRVRVSAYNDTCQPGEKFSRDKPGLRKGGPGSSVN